MQTKLITNVRKIWKDLGAALVIAALIITSIKVQYNLGILVGFLILFFFLSFDRIKKIIFDMNVKRIFGIEFGEIDKEIMKENVRKDLDRRGLRLGDDEIEVVTEAALNQISGVAYKARYYEEMVLYALRDLNVDFQKNLSGSFGRDHFSVDFVVELENDRVLGIEAVYSDRHYLPKDRIDQIIKTSDTLKKVDNLSHFALITNTEITDEDRSRLQGQEPPIDVIDRIISPDGILTRLQEYLKHIDRDRKGSLETKTEPHMANAADT